MAESALAPSTAAAGDAGQQINRLSDPFARNPDVRPTVSFPPPCVQRIKSPPPSLYANQHPRPRETGSDATLFDDTADYKAGSMSSGGSSFITPISSVDLEKAVLAHAPGKSPPPRPESRRVSRQSRRSAPPSMSDHVRMQYAEEEEDGEEGNGTKLQEDKAVKILLFLSGPCVLLSALLSAWTVLSILITAFTQPVRLCARRPTFGQQLAGLLGPALNLQLKCIYTPLPPHANDDRSYHAFMLVMVHILSPFISLGMTFLAWVLAVYWASSAVVGDPAGMDNKDDGRETVLSLRQWWETYLMRSVMDE